jgi:hypothetical protein
MYTVNKYLKKTKNKNKRINKTKRKKNKKYKQRGGKRKVLECNSYKEIIDFIKREIFIPKTTHEICGSIIQQSHTETVPKYTVYFHELPIPQGTRPACMYEDYSDGIIWHTHPIKVYPSVEDVLKVIKSKNYMIRVSNIFTPVGLWELIPEQRLDESSISEEFIKKIIRILDSIYFQTNNGTEYSSYIDRSVEMLTRLLEENNAKTGIRFIRDDMLN